MAHGGSDGEVLECITGVMGCMAGVMDKYWGTCRKY